MEMITYNDTDYGNDSVMANFSICGTVKTILAPPYQDILIAECVLAWLAIPPNLTLLLVIWHVSVFSLNLRLLMAHFRFILLWYAVGTIVRSIYTFVSFDCEHPMSVRACKIFELASTGLVLANVLYSFLALCAQRLHAALKYKKYDKMTQNRPWLACSLIIASWATVLVVNCADMRTLPSDKYLAICAASFIPSRFTATFYVYLAFEILAAITITFIYFYTKFVARNMGINRAQFDLSSRFQVSQNVHINATIIPSFLLHILCHIPTFVLLSGLSGEWIMTLETRPWLTRITHVLRLVYAIAHPICALCVNSNLRNHLLELKIGAILLGCAALCQKAKPKENGVAVTIQAHYFYNLDKIWADQKQPPGSKKGTNKKGPKNAWW